MALSKLGRSFTELIESNRDETPEEMVLAPVEKIVPNPHQPRRTFDETAIAELAGSIKAHGLLQPIVAVRRDGGYEVVAGERRLRAVRSLGWTTAPVRLVELDASGSLQAAIIENVQREELNAIECARAYRELITRFGLTQSQLAERISKSRSAIANLLRLLELPEKIQMMVVNAELSAGHARALLGAGSPGETEALAERVVRDGLSVRDVEELVSSKKAPPAASRKTVTDPNVQALGRELGEALGTRVRIKDRGNNKGRIVIEYHDIDSFENIRSRLMGRL